MRPSTAHARLGPAFFDPVAPAAFETLTLRYRNRRAALSVGLDGLDEARWLAHFGRFVPIAGSFGTPLALRYHGHQFGTYNPDLGDGRGFLFAQLHDDRGRLLDLGTKGSGTTPWSRGGDGRLTLKGGVREVLAALMLEALGVDTSKPLSLVETGDELDRHDEPAPARAGVLVRLSHGHVRIGTFQRLAFLGDTDNLRRLVTYCLATYFGSDGGGAPAATLLAATVARVAATGADLMAAGFVHGVLNTDNINITGESFDYGPWRFLPHFDPAFTAAYFDTSGYYAFGRQPDALAWNLTRLAECLLPLGDQAGLEAALNTFWPCFRRALWSAVLRRLALLSAGAAADADLATGIFAFLDASRIGFERFWFDWRGGLLSAGRAAASPAAAHYAGTAFAPVRAALEGFAPAPGARLAHPYFARPAPRTMLLNELEALWAPIAAADDWSAFAAALAGIEEMRDAYAGDGSPS
jgi:uncharacterized protein YdiU (UPF0061 family)